MSDLVRADPRVPVRSIFASRRPQFRSTILQGARIFNGPDGLQYRWRPSGNSADVFVSRTTFLWCSEILNDANFLPPQLQDGSGNVIAIYRPTRPTRYQLGDVYGELHFIRSAGQGTVVCLVAAI
jgi:hypothetical protein